MAKPFATLRALMHANDETAANLARLLLVTPAAISHKMNGHTSWRLDEMYAILDHYYVPHMYLHEVFPRDGKNGALGKPNSAILDMIHAS